MKYRSEIDGLRALALIPVILFHAGFEWFGGGFVGVDVFFVISGYLITTIIISEIEDEKFSIVNFYERRARRIMPALFFVTLFCVLFGWYWFAPSYFKDFGQSLVAVSTFSSNILFWLKSGYFDTASELKPLLHTWSLAVEEQYYIIFPLFLMLTWKFGLKWILFLLSIIFFASLIGAHWGAYTRPSATFYLLPTRGWELLIGVFAAFYLKHKSYFTSHKTNQILSILGLGMIVYSIGAFDKDTPFPSLYTLVPTIGTGLLILSAVPNTIANKLLSFSPVVGIGLISYSAYLWHQPILAFARHKFLLELSDFLLLALCLASLVMGYISWKWVEQPFRDKRKTTRTFIFAFSISGIVLFGLIGMYTHLKNGFPSRMSDTVSSGFLKREDKDCNFQFDALSSQEKEINQLVAECTKENNIFLIGDSHAQALSYSLSKKLDDIGINLITITQDGCLPINGVSRKFSNPACESLKAFLYEYIFVEGNKIIISARWRLNINGVRYDNGEGGKEYGKNGQVFLTKEKNSTDLYQHLIDEINAISAKVSLTLVNQIPEVGWNVPDVYFSSPDVELTHSYAEYLSQNANVNQILTSIENSSLVHTDKLVCDDLSMRCLTKIEGAILYYDDDHPSLTYADLISESIIKTLDFNQLKFIN